LVELTVNSNQYSIDVDGSTPLLWVLRDRLKLFGTKFGCGIGQCGACTVHIDGESFRSCLLPVSQVNGRSITTIEGLVAAESPVVEAWIEKDVPQCGFCQPGQIMAVSAMLSKEQNPSDEFIDKNLTNLCRCGTYHRIRKGIHRAVELMKDEETSRD
jgi:isoquinoline 1-oxidoreductase alpha subunit